MNDVGFMALVEDVISYVDERFGRSFAWALALSVTALPTGVLAFMLIR